MDGDGQEMKIRQEAPHDAEAISSVIEEAFAHHPHSNQTEHILVDGLRKAGALLVSLVAEEEGQVVGHISFSPVRIGGSDTGWMVLAPVAVRAACQRRGIGKALVKAGLDAIRALGAQGCVLAGDPRYYGRFGFRPMAELVLPGVPPEYFLALAFGGPPPEGEVTCHPAFAVCT